MNFGNPVVLPVLGLVLAVAGCWMATHYFSAEAKAERRRRRSNTRIATNAKRPMVKFSVRTKRERRK